MKNIKELEKLMTEEQKKKASAAYKKHYEDLFYDGCFWFGSSMIFQERLEKAYGKIIEEKDWE